MQFYKCNDDVFNFSDILRSVIFDTSKITSRKENSAKELSYTSTLKRVEKIQSPPADIVYKTNKKEKEKTKIINSSIFIAFSTRLETLPVLKLRRHTDTLTEASSSVDELYEKDEIQNRKQIEILWLNFNILNNFEIFPLEMKPPSKFSKEIVFNTTP